MKAYLITTGTIFALLVLVHIWRMVEEGASVASDPWYILITLLAAGMTVWAFRLLRLSSRQ